MSEPIENMYAPPAAPAEVATPIADSDDRLGWMLLAVPAAAGVIGPLLTLVSTDLGGLIAFPMFIATMILVAKDAPRWGLKPSRQMIGLLLIWAIYFPLYFHRRAAKGAPPRVLHAIVSELMYLGGFFVLGFVRALSAG